jgi:hypothetical protein
MKKLLVAFSAVLFITVGMSSCGKKDYTCTCTGNQSIQRVIIPNATKAQAETICKGGETYTQGSTNIQSCKLD